MLFPKLILLKNITKQLDQKVPFMSLSKRTKELMSSKGESTPSLFVSYQKTKGLFSNLIMRNESKLKRRWKTNKNWHWHGLIVYFVTWLSISVIWQHVIYQFVNWLSATNAWNVLHLQEIKKQMWYFSVFVSTGSHFFKRVMPISMSADMQTVHNQLLMI